MTQTQATVLDEAYEGAIIGQSYRKRALWIRRVVGMPLIYVPLVLTIPFVILNALLVRWHLRQLGAHNMKTYQDFLPAWASHRYNYGNQAVSSPNPLALAHYKWFWIFNCKLYCPMSIALFRYCVYLIKIVENWWCPFDHARKQDYVDASIDASYWHIDSRKKALLDPQDRDNPIWNADKREK